MIDTITNIVADISVADYALFMKGLGGNIARARKAKRLRQIDLANLANVNVETVNRVEHDINITTERLYRIVAALGKTLGELLPDDQKGPYPLHHYSENEWLHQMLDAILTAQDPKWAQGIRINIEALFAASAPSQDKPIEGNHSSGPTTRPFVRRGHK